MLRRTTSIAISPSASSEFGVLSAPLAVQAPRPVRDIRVTLWRLRVHISGRHAKYYLRVENRGPDAVETYTHALASGAEEDPGASAAVTVPGFASLSVKLLIALPRSRRAPARVVTEVTGAGSTLVFAESEPPRLHARPLFLLAAALLTVAWWFGAAALTPKVTVLAAPADIRASRPFSVAYALSGSHQAHYSVVSANGFVAAAGTIVGRQGVFDVALPFTTTPEIYSVRIEAYGRLGDVARTARIVAEPDPAIPAPSATLPRRTAAKPRPAARPFGIDALAVAKDSIAGGKSVIVYYRVASVDGLLRLIDQYGTVRAEALLDRRGNSILLAPYVEADQDFRIVLHAARGSAQADKSIPLRITKERSLDDVLAAARRKNDGPIALVNETVAPGDPIEIGIARYEPGMRVALVDPLGQEIASSAVADDQNEVTFTAPAIAGTQRFTVTVSFMSGVSQETVVRNLTIGGKPSPEATP